MDVCAFCDSDASTFPSELSTRELLYTEGSTLTITDHKYDICRDRCGNNLKRAPEFRQCFTEQTPPEHQQPLIH